MEELVSARIVKTKNTSPLFPLKKVFTISN